MSCPFLRNSLVLRTTPPLILIAPVFWPVGCTTPPAHPQAEPLPDNEVVQVRPGAISREKMVEIVLTEWDRWGRRMVHVGRDDTYCVTGGGFSGRSQDRWLTPGNPMLTPSDEESGTDMLLLEVIAEPVAPARAPCLRYPDGTGGEATARGYILAKCYWGIVGKIPTRQQLTTGGWARSAVFISWIICRTGLQNDQFLTGATCAEYVTSTRDRPLRYSAFVLERTPAVPCPGDLVCTARGADRFMTDPAGIQASKTSMHCGLVVEMDPVRHEVKSVDGNVQRSASMSITELNDTNQLSPCTSSVMQQLVVLCN